VGKQREVGEGEGGSQPGGAVTPPEGEIGGVAMGKGA